MSSKKKKLIQKKTTPLQVIKALGIEEGKALLYGAISEIEGTVAPRFFPWIKSWVLKLHDEYPWTAIEICCKKNRSRVFKFLYIIVVLLYASTLPLRLFMQFFFLWYTKFNYNIFVSTEPFKSVLLQHIIKTYFDNN